MNFLNKYTILLFILIIFSIEAKSQSVGISDDTSFVPDPSSILDLGVGNKGFLLPRIALIAIDNPAPVTAPANGLIVFNTNAAITGGVGFYYWTSADSKWNKILTEELETTGWQLTGNAGLNPAINYIGTSDEVALSIRTNGVQRILVDSDGKVYIANNTEITGDLVIKNDTKTSTFRTSAAQVPDNITYIFPLNQGDVNSFLKNDGSGNLVWETISESNPSWELEGNAGTNPDDPENPNFIGTTDAVDFTIRTDNTIRVRVEADGDVSITNKLFTADKLTVSDGGADISGNTLLTGDFTLYNLSNFGSIFSTNPSQSASISYILPLLQGATDSYLKNDGSGNLTWATIAGANPAWELTGNAGTDTSVNFIGTLDATPLLFRTDTVVSMRLMTNGNLGIGRVPPDESAILELNCNKKGILFTRLTSNERNGINYPAKYLTIYNIDNERFEINKGSALSPVWVPLIDSIVLNNIGWTLHGNTGTTSANNFIGTIDNSGFTIRTNNIERIKVTYDGHFEFLNPSSFYNSFITSPSQDINISYIFPLTAGAENTYLKNDGSGNLSWATVGGGGDSYWTLSGNELSPIDDSYHIATGGSITGFLANAIGYNNTASGSRSIALGSETVASAYAATALGHQTTASGERSVAMGENTTASGSRTTASGSYTTAYSAYETAIGRYNTTYTPLSTTAWETADRLFVIGNGTSPSEFEKSDALIIYKNGNMNLFGNFSINNSSDFANTFVTSSGQAADISYNLPETQGAVNSYLKNDGTGNLSWATIGGANPAWELTGNSGTNPTTNFIGTSDAQDLSIRTSATERIRIAAAGNVNIYGNTEINGNLSINNSSDFTNTFSTSSGQAVDISYNLPETQGAVSTYLKNDGTGNLSWATIGGANPAWELTGNSGTNPTTNFIGTSDAVDLSIRTSASERIRITVSGNIGIGTSTPDASAIVDINTTTKGILFPRMTTAERNAITTPASYLTVFNSTNQRFELNKGTPASPLWVPLVDSIVLNNVGWTTTGNSGTNPTTNFIGTTDANALSIRTSSTEIIRIGATGDIGINEATPSQPLTIKGNVLLEPNGATASEFRFAVPNDTSKYTAFRARTQLTSASQLVYTLPDSQAVAPIAVLANDGTGNLNWTNMTTLSGYMHVPVFNVTTSYTITNEDYIVIVQQAGTYTIPQATNNNKGKILYMITDCSYGTLSWSVQSQGGSLIDCEASWSSSTQIQGLMICSDGTNWHIINTRRLN